MKTIFAMMVVLVCVQIAGAMEYLATDLGNLGRNGTMPTALNNLGQVVGTSNDSGYVMRAFSWENGVMTNLGPGPGGEPSWTPEGINDAGQIVGSANSIILRENNVTKNLGIPWGGYAWSAGINQEGKILVTSVWQSGASRLFLWQGRYNEMTQPMGPYNPAIYGQGTAVNDSGKATYNANTPDGQDAYLYTDNSVAPVRIGSSAWTYSTDINNYDKVVGQVISPAGIPEAFYWGGSMTFLGTLGGNESKANAINNNGEIVGVSRNSQGSERAFLFRGDGLVDINSLTACDRVLTNAVGINDMGQIIATSSDGHGWFLTPIPEPASLVLLCLGSIALVRKRRR